MSVPSTLAGKLGTVAHVDRLYSRVFLKERVFKVRTRPTYFSAEAV
jgi:hypothetical protein